MTSRGSASTAPPESDGFSHWGSAADTSSMRVAAVASLALVAMIGAGCGGSGRPAAGEAQAAAACKTGGAQAAQLASQAAASNAKYATLAADENALAASESTQQNELSDGSGGDDSGLGDLTGATAVGSAASTKVLTDCTSLGLSVTH
jgi:hypothetical protein